VYTNKTTEGEGSLLVYTDAYVQKYGERTGLDTLVVHTVTYEY
jgi:hypothetical protein